MKRYLILCLLGACALMSCTLLDTPSQPHTNPDGSFVFNVECEPVEGEAQTKSAFSSSALTKVSNVNIYVYRGGSLIDSKYFGSASGITMDFPSNTDTYNVYMLANVGQFTAPSSESALKDVVYSFTDYGGFESKGFPMANSFLGYKPGSQTSFKLKRLIGMYSITMEKSSTVVSYRIKSLQMRNCARDIYPFGTAPATKFLESGDYLSSSDIATLNAGGSVNIYFLENRQGELLPNNRDPKQKIPDNLPDRTVASHCTYLQMQADVTTATAHFDNIYYRVYLGQNMTTDFSIVRSTLYNLNLDFATNLIADEGWRIEPEDPDVIGAINLNKTEAGVIKGIDDIIYVTTQSANGSPVDFTVIPNASEASAAGLTYTTFKTTYHGKSATAIRFSTSMAIDGLNSYNEAPENNCKKVNVKIQSKDTYNGVPTISKNVVVRAYHQVFPIYFKAKQEGSYWYLYAYSNNPLKLGYQIAFNTNSGQNSSYVRSGSGRFQRYAIEDNFFDEDADWSVEDYTLNRNGSKVGCLGATSEYSGGMRLNITVTPITDGNFTTPYSNDCFLEYPKFTSTTAYMGTGTKAYFGPGTSLSPGNTPDFSSNSDYNFNISGSPTATSYSGFSTDFLSSSGYNFIMSSSSTGWNRQDSYSLSSFAGVPFYFVNGGLTCFEREAFVDEPKYLNDNGRVGVEIHAYEPGRDLGMFSRNTTSFGFKIGTMTQFLGNIHTWQNWKSYDYTVYMTINGCSSWPGASYSSTGFSPGMYVQNIDFD